MTNEQSMNSGVSPRRFGRYWSVVCSVLVAWMPAIVQACPVCYGDPEDPLVKGVEAGVIMMVVMIYGVLVLMLGVVGMWFVRARRIRQSADAGTAQIGRFVRDLPANPTEDHRDTE